MDRYKEKSDKTRRKYRVLAVFFLIILPLAVFWEVSGFEFLSWDDGANIYDNPRFDPVTLDSILLFWKQPFLSLYIPVTYTLWSVLAWISHYFILPGDSEKISPLLFHMANLYIHILNGIIVFSILNILRARTEDSAEVTVCTFTYKLAPCLGALFFLVHPIQVEAVCWITGMKDLLCGLFSLFAVRQYLVYAGLHSYTERRGTVRTGSFYYCSALFSFVLALLSKPGAVVIPILLFILDKWILKRSLKEIILSLTMWFVLCLPAVIITKISQPNFTLDFVPPLLERPFVAGDAVAFYLCKLFLPFHLGPDYGRSPEYLLTQWWARLSWLFPAGVAFFLFFFKKYRHLLVSFWIFTVGILPVLGFVPFGFQNFSTVADRYLYLSMLGPAIAISRGTARSAGKNVFILFIVVISIMGFVSRNQAEYWRSSFALFKHAVVVNPDSPVAYNNVGFALYEQGKSDEALSYYLKALELDPGYADVCYNLGVLYMDNGLLDKAIVYYRKSIVLKEDFTEAFNNIGATLARQGAFEEAISYYRKAILIEPDFANAHFNLGYALSKRGRAEEAVVHYSAAIRYNPGYGDAYNNLGIILVSRGMLDEAVLNYTKAISIDPSYTRAYNNLANALMKLGRRKEAIKHYREALRLDPDNNAIRNNLEIALRNYGKNTSIK